MSRCVSATLQRSAASVISTLRFCSAIHRGASPVCHVPRQPTRASLCSASVSAALRSKSVPTDIMGLHAVITGLAPIGFYQPHCQHSGLLSWKFMIYHSNWTLKGCVLCHCGYFFWCFL